jgi:hypothetical protein
MPIDLLFSVGATSLVTLLAGFMTSLLARRRGRDLESLREEAERLATVYEKELQVRKATVIESAVGTLQASLSQPDVERLLDELVKRLPATTPPGAESPVEDLISSYHEQALGQARAQFWFSIIAATVGFVWIFLFGADSGSSNSNMFGRILPGVVMDAVAFLFFRQASETRQRATELYDRLRRDKLVSESIALVSSIEDIRIRSVVKAQIALHMSGLEPSAIDVGRLSEVSKGNPSDGAQPA